MLRIAIDILWIYYKIPTYVGFGLLITWVETTVVSRLSTHPFKYASQLSTHFLAKNLGFKIY
jgi:hypothetical protein